MTNKKKISWFSLFIKIIIVFVTILIIAWLVGKIINKNNLSSTFKNNINNMEEAAIKYFKNIDLPTEKGKSKKITLEEGEIVWVKKYSKSLQRIYSKILDFVLEREQRNVSVWSSSEEYLEERFEENSSKPGERTDFKNSTYKSLLPANT